MSDDLDVARGRQLRTELAARFKREQELAFLTDKCLAQTFRAAGLAGGDLIVSHLHSGFPVPFGKRVFAILERSGMDTRYMLAPLDELDEEERRLAVAAICASLDADRPRRARRTP